VHGHASSADGRTDGSTETDGATSSRSDNLDGCRPANRATHGRG
jgi:hypothetical protein